MKIGFTGTKKGMTPKQISDLYHFLSQYYVGGDINEFHHGDCIGADLQSAFIAEELGYEVHVHPPNNSSKRGFYPGKFIYFSKGYLKRNHDIVDACDVLLATPSGNKEEVRSGTWATIRYARKINRKMIIIFP